MASSEGARAPSFLPLEAGAAGSSKKRKQRSSSSRILTEFDEQGKRRSSVVYIGRIPHGFYEDQMRGYFSQFGAVTRLRLSRNKKTGKSKHYAFVEFETPEIAQIVAESMNNYLMFGRMLQVKIVPTDQIHPSLWNGANKKFYLPSKTKTNEEMSLERRQRLVEKFARKDKARRTKLQALGYDYPEIEISNLAPTKTRFD
ncbi:uncharacterized RNA-binding protein C1827.05c [Selaginella moellendorffii]|uniref:uncharacterized RNA-binding protein C1827.05c n=1 Tax=Selaginella moellendorffii TaxID=88036 RepID=UPI000D1D0F9C|nr:uncharacterized RNA-binding protein C1827.05c [Selaginella moellendorffii]|eukprot:XP_024530188.1 uncharacterized RNA-binding protein C1827.05c [Selaginella moellendorffii]